MAKKKAICLMSGGLDSAVVAALAQAEGYKLHFLATNYGQKANERELCCVRELARFYSDAPLEIIDLPWLGQFGASGLTDATTYLSTENAQLEYVPFRNTILLSIAVAWAETILADCVLIGSIGGPWLTPDNRPEFFDAMQKVVHAGTQLKTDIQIRVPFGHSKKVEVVAKGIELHVPFEITWSCHNREDIACGECSNCLDRLGAFHQLNLEDPLPYVNHRIG
jgi:7-cyano-7-deazaguanine synthase